MVRVTLQDLSNYPDTVVYCATAPIYDTVICADFNAAFDIVIEFGAEFQSTIEPIEVVNA